jgi:hypothetical protein
MRQSLARLGTYAERFKNYRWKNEEGKPVVAWRRWQITKCRAGVLGFTTYAYLFLAPTPDILWDRERRWDADAAANEKKVHGLVARSYDSIQRKVANNSEFSTYDSPMRSGADVHNQD